MTGPAAPVIDLSHYDTISDWQAAKDDGVYGVIHKATEGTQYIDASYAHNRVGATANGLWWGAYHFGTGADPIVQADHFLATAKPDAKTLLVLDFETEPGGSSMSLAQAEAFVTRVHDKVGRWPVLYTGRWYLNKLLDPQQKTVLSNCPLWPASYTSEVSVPPQWTTWSLWQYTDGQVGPEPHLTAGIGACDRSRFNGLIPELATLWGIIQ